MRSPEPIEIHEYSAAWVSEFQELGAQLREALGDVALRIDHIGSTSVEGLAAKPVIDLQISVRKLDPVDPFLEPMESLGYVWKKDNPEKTKRYFREGSGRRRTHVHVRRAGSWNEQFALLFRDYIRAHLEDQRKYETVKRELATKHRLERHKYTDAKDTVIWEIIYRADVWAKETGWEPGEPDF